LGCSRQLSGMLVESGQLACQFPEQSGQLSGQISLQSGQLSGQFSEQSGQLSGQISLQSGQLSGQFSGQPGQLSGQFSGQSGQFSEQSGQLSAPSPPVENMDVDEIVERQNREIQDKNRQINSLLRQNREIQQKLEKAEKKAYLFTGTHLTLTGQNGCSRKIVTDVYQTKHYNTTLARVSRCAVCCRMRAERSVIEGFAPGNKKNGPQPIRPDLLKKLRNNFFCGKTGYIHRAYRTGASYKTLMLKHECVSGLPGVCEETNELYMRGTLPMKRDVFSWCTTHGLPTDNCNLPEDVKRSLEQECERTLRKFTSFTSLSERNVVGKKRQPKRPRARRN